MNLLFFLLSLAHAAPDSAPESTPTEQARWLIAQWEQASRLGKNLSPSARVEEQDEARISREKGWIELEMHLAQGEWRGDARAVALLSLSAAMARETARANAAELLAGKETWTLEKKGLRQTDLLEWQLATRLHAWTWRTPAPPVTAISIDIEIMNLESDLKLPRRCWPRGAVDALTPLLGEARAARDRGDRVVMGALTVVLVEAHREVNLDRCVEARGPIQAPTVPTADATEIPAPLVDWQARLGAHLVAAAGMARGGELIEQATRELLVWDQPQGLPPELEEQARRIRWEAVMEGAEQSWRAWTASRTTCSPEVIEAGRGRSAAMMAYALDELRHASPRIYP